MISEPGNYSHSVPFSVGAMAMVVKSRIPFYSIRFHYILYLRRGRRTAEGRAAGSFIYSTGT
jgi:hypothetical protein